MIYLNLNYRKEPHNQKYVNKILDFQDRIFKIEQ